MDQLDGPLDPRHPTRHSIWTPVFDALQDRVYVKRRLRLDDRLLFIENAVRLPNEKPSNTSRDWAEKPELAERIRNFTGNVQTNKPRILVTFGQFAYEFARRATSGNDSSNYHPVKFWTQDKLGTAFAEVTAPRPARENPDSRRPILVPLLHATIARRHFLRAHDAYCRDQDRTYRCHDARGNYFRYTGTRLADLILSMKPELSVWLGSSPEARKCEI